jgi:hypothetical protein
MRKSNLRTQYGKLRPGIEIPGNGRAPSGRVRKTSPLPASPQKRRGVEHNANAPLLASPPTGRGVEGANSPHPASPLLRSGGRTKPAPYDPPGNLTCEAAAAVARAFEFAAGLRDTHVRLTHLWAAIASEPSAGRSVWFGTHRRPDADRAEAQVRRQMLRRFKVLGLLRRERTPGPEDERSRRTPPPQLPLAHVTRQVLRRAVREARELGHARIGTEHFVLALMRQVRARLFRGAERYCEANLEVRREVASIAGRRLGDEESERRRVEVMHGAADRNVRPGDQSRRVRAPGTGLRTARLG